MLLAIGTCTLVFYIACAMSGKKYDQSQLGKEESALPWFISGQNSFLPHVLALKMDNFVVKVKPKKIC